MGGPEEVQRARLLRWMAGWREGGEEGTAVGIRRKFFIQYLRRLISEQIEFYYPTVGARWKSSFSFYFITPKLCIRVRRRWQRGDGAAAGRADAIRGVPFDGLKI